MKWLRRKDGEASNGYWDTISDVMSSLLLILLLVVVLLILYVVRAPEYKANKTPDSEIVNDGKDAQYVELEAGHKVVVVDVPYWLPGTEHEEYGRGELEGDFLYEEGGFGEGEFDGHEGAAVRVIMEDAETHKAVGVPNVIFGLYSTEGRRKTLYTFYPTITGWDRFLTDDSGSFYFPQKMPVTSYTLHQVTIPESYMSTGDQTFTIDEAHSWAHPYIVHVPIVPVKSSIRIIAEDSKTNDPVPDAVYDIIAAADIVTLDGTVRYKAGEIVDQIKCGADGTGESIPLYLGQYTIKQSTPPDYYAMDYRSYEITLNTTEPGVVTQSLLCDRTAIIINCVDELYSGISLPGAGFTMKVNDSDEAQTLFTDETGLIVCNTLQKNTTYTFCQVTAPQDYKINNEVLQFAVNEDGRIDGSAAIKKTVTNRTLRASVAVFDSLFRNPVSRNKVTLYDAYGRTVKSWSSTDIPTVIQGLDVGKYRIEISGDGYMSLNADIADIADVQKFVCNVWTKGNKTFAFGCGFGLLGVSALITVFSLKRRKRRKSN